MDFKPTVFVVEINGQEFKFAAMTHREMERLVETEKALESDPDREKKLKSLNAETVASVLNRGGMVDAEGNPVQTSAEEIAEKMPVPVFQALLRAIFAAQGIKMEVKSTGEVRLS